MKSANRCYALVLFLLLINDNSLLAQDNCIYKDPVLTLNFGTTEKDGVPTLYNLNNYTKSNRPCPDDGHYSFVTATANCFDGKWHSLTEDHTPGDVNGKMMMVNAAQKPGAFFEMMISGLRPGGKYRFSGWFANICKYTIGCAPATPLIEINVYAGNNKLGSFNTGEIKQANSAEWKNYTGEFVMASTTDVIQLQMKNLAPGGCGNDFAMDDIEINLCSLPVADQQTKLTNPDVQNFSSPLPKVLETRANPVIRQITLEEEAEISIELYDNGEIDGDTVSIFHNNKLIVDHAGISARPVAVKIKADKANPHHELTMVADNLGKIPPNTSLMVITAGKKRYEVFISSSEQKNAKVLIDLQ